MIRLLLLTAVFLQVSFSIPLLNRLLVPVYYSTSFIYGYDNNILKFSDEEKSDSEIEPWLLGKNEISSSVIKGGASLTYLPYIFNNHETQLKVKLNYSDFIDSADKKYYSYSFKLAQHLSPFSWLKLSYSLLPNLYLREYIDRDNPIYYFYDSGAFFSIENSQIQYSHPIPLKKSYFSISYNLQKQYYNGEFTEFDLDINDFKIGLYLRYNPHSKISVSITKSIANDITFQDTQNIEFMSQDVFQDYFSNEYVAEPKDRGYEQNRIWVSASVDEAYNPFFDEIGLSTSIEHRIFSSNSLTDPLHQGRSHYDKKISLWIKENIYKNIDVKIYGSYRSRITSSDKEFVEQLKSFNKYDFFIKFIYKSSLNIYF